MKPGVPCILIAMIFAACTSRHRNEREDNQVVGAKRYLTDTIVFAPATLEPTAASPYYVSVHSLDWFSETNEYFTPLYYKAPFTNATGEALQSELDSLILDQDDITRERLPMTVAASYFELPPDTLMLFLPDGNPSGKAALNRVEFFSGPVISEFIGVYSPVNSPEQQASFGIGGLFPAGSLKLFTAETIQGVSDLKQMLQEFEIDSTTRVWGHDHVRLLPDSTVYSYISYHCDTCNLETNYITESHDSAFAVVMSLKRDYLITGFQPIPVYTYGKPILMLYAGLPESDFTWTEVTWYNGSGYVVAEGNRVSLPARPDGDSIGTAPLVPRN